MVTGAKMDGGSLPPRALDEEILEPEPNGSKAIWFEKEALLLLKSKPDTGFGSF
jgi:hypothetical protein